MLLHTIGRLGAAALNPDPFIQFLYSPANHLPSLSQLLEASQKPRDLYDERFYRMGKFYLAGAIMLFETGSGCNYQMQFIRDRRALPIVRDYMAEAESLYRRSIA